MRLRLIQSRRRSKLTMTTKVRLKGSVDKKYVLAGDLLAVQCWTCDDPAIDFDLFTRVQDPTSAELMVVGSSMGLGSRQRG